MFYNSQRRPSIALRLQTRDSLITGKAWHAWGAAAAAENGQWIDSLKSMAQLVMAVGKLGRCVKWSRAQCWVVELCVWTSWQALLYFLHFIWRSPGLGLDSSSIKVYIALHGLLWVFLYIFWVHFFFEFMVAHFFLHLITVRTKQPLKYHTAVLYMIKKKKKPLKKHWLNQTDDWFQRKQTRWTVSFMNFSFKIPSKQAATAVRWM